MAPTVINEPAFAAEDASRLAKTDLTRCTLLMNIGPHQLAYAILDPEDQAVISVKGYFFDTGSEPDGLIRILEQCFDRDRMLFTAFLETRISLDVPTCCIIPSDLYDPALKREYLSFLHPVPPDSVLWYDQVNSQKLVHLYAADKNLAGYLKKEFPAARFYHTQTAFLCALVRFAPTREPAYACVRVLTDSVIVTVVREGQLLMMQAYPITHPTDALYHTVNALMQLGLAPADTPVFLSGEIEEDSPLYLELVQASLEIHWLKRPAGFRYAPSFGEYPAHHFYHLISLASCE